MSTAPKKRRVKAETPVRRPDAETRAEELQRENPTWSWGTCLVKAKLERNK